MNCVHEYMIDSPSGSVISMGRCRKCHHRQGFRNILTPEEEHRITIRRSRYPDSTIQVFTFHSKRTDSNRGLEREN